MPDVSNQNRTINLFFDGRYVSPSASSPDFTAMAGVSSLRIPMSHSNQFWLHESSLNTFFMAVHAQKFPWTVNDTEGLFKQNLKQVQSICGQQMVQARVEYDDLVHNAPVRIDRFKGFMIGERPTALVSVTCGQQDIA